MYGVPIAEDTPDRTSAINASGRLTSEQIKLVRIARSYVTQAVYTIVVPFVLIGGYGIDTIQARLEALPGQLGETLYIGWSAVMFVGLTLFTVYIVRALRLQSRFAREVSKGEVTSVDDALRWRGRRYVAETAGPRLDIPDLLAAAWYPGSYRFYYLPKSRVVAAAERLDTPLPYAE